MKKLIKDTGDYRTYMEIVPATSTVFAGVNFRIFSTMESSKNPSEERNIMNMFFTPEVFEQFRDSINSFEMVENTMASV